MNNVIDSAAVDSSALPEILDALRRRYHGERYPEREQRLRCLAQLAAMLRDNAQAWCDAVSQDFGHRSPTETRLAELFPALEGVRHAKKHLASWMAPQGRAVSWWFKPARAQVQAQPLGVVGVIVPWNYPIYLAVGPMIAALAAGNRVMVKMSEFTPATGALMQGLCRRYLDGWVEVVNGDAAVAATFSALPFDHLLFTGSTAIGRQVMRAASENLTPVTLELGGKSPTIVAPGFDPKRAAEAIVVGKMLNAGQTCVAPDYILVKASEEDALVAAIVATATRLYPTLARNPDYSAVISARHRARLGAYVSAARAAGAQVIEVNPAGEDLSDCGKMPLTLLRNLEPDAPALHDELFGPVLPIVSYRKFADAIAYVNARPRPLALYLFDEDPLRIARVERETVAGGMCINTTVLHVAQDDLPFGGVGPSGIGHYHAHEGFLTFSKLKPVFSVPRWNLLRLTQPPYGRTMSRLLGWMLR